MRTLVATVAFLSSSFGQPPQLVSRSLGQVIFNYDRCIEPLHRKASASQSPVMRNILESKPEKYVCEFCDETLSKLIKDVCCGARGRQRRDTEQHKFWFKSPLQTNLSAIHRQNSYDWTKQCPKDSDSTAPDSVKTLMRSKRQTDPIDYTDHTNWINSQQNGGKGRTTTYGDENKWNCTLNIPRSQAADFLTRSLSGRNARPDRYKNRRKYKHTFVQQECCGGGECNGIEVMETNLNEECCNEGCLVEEVVENCGVLRWDVKESWYL